MIDQERIEKILTEKIHLKIDSVKIERLKGDASNRTYHRIRLSSISRPRSLILMVLAEPEAFKKSEEKVTRSSIPVKELPYINILNHLLKEGIAVPKIYYYDRKAGWLFLEDLGDVTVEMKAKHQANSIVKRYYTLSIDELIKIHTRTRRDRNKSCIAFGRALDVPLLMWEFDHFLEYGIPYCTGSALNPSDRNKIRREFRKIAVELAHQPKTFTHRDYHSRNLMVHNNRVWVLDFQDALLGPHVYDLASLLRDSYRVLEESMVDALLSYYFNKMKGSINGIQNQDRFRRLFDLMSIQRNLKAAGRFVYIQQEKKNPRFLPYIPQTIRYVRRNLDKYAELTPLRRLLDPYLSGIDMK